MNLTKSQKLVSWGLQAIAAVILFQTLFFKFSGSEESKFIFQTLGLEPWGRIGSGVAELIAVLMLLMPRTVIWGALLAMGVMVGAIFSHLGRLGLVVMNDGGLLFGLALTVFSCCIGVLIIRRREIPVVRKLLFSVRKATY